MERLYPLKKLTLAATGERVVADLRMQIIAGSIEKGKKISENQIAKEYEVSRSPVREAFKTLEKEGLIRLERMGAFVIGITEKDINEFYDIRFMIESFVFERVLKQNNRLLIKELEQIIEMMNIAVKYDDADEFSFKDIEFHEAIIKSIDHHYLLMLWSNLRPVMECLILLSMRNRLKTDKTDFVRVIQNHELMLRSILEKDKQLVQKAFFKNFQDVVHDHDYLDKGAEKQ